MSEVREDMVEKLLQHFRDSKGATGFLGIEWQHEPPTDEERAEAERRYVDELAERGMPEELREDDAGPA